MTAPKRPGEMADEAWAIIARLPSEKRDRVLERSAATFYGGVHATLAESDAAALLSEAGVSLQGELAGMG